MEKIHRGCIVAASWLVKYSHWVNRILNPLGPKMSSFLLKLSRVSYSHWEQNANFEYTLNTHIEYLLSMQSTFWVSLCTLGEWLHILKLSKKLLDFGPMDWVAFSSHLEYFLFSVFFRSILILTSHFFLRAMPMIGCFELIWFLFCVFILCTEVTLVFFGHKEWVVKLSVEYLSVGWFGSYRCTLLLLLLLVHAIHLS